MAVQVDFKPNGRRSSTLILCLKSPLVCLSTPPFPPIPLPHGPPSPVCLSSLCFCTLGALPSLSISPSQQRFILGACSPFGRPSSNSLVNSGRAILFPLFADMLNLIIIDMIPIKFLLVTPVSSSSHHPHVEFVVLSLTFGTKVSGALSLSCQEARSFYTAALHVV